MNMRVFLTLLFFFIVSSNTGYCDEPVDYTRIYGPGLYDVPFLIRKQFQAETGKAWPEVSLDERSHYLARWDQSKKNAVDDKDRYLKERENEKERYQKAKEERLEKAERRAEQLERAAEQKAEESRRKQERLEKLKENRERALERLKEMSERRNNQ